MTTGGAELWRALAAVADNPTDARTAAHALSIPAPDAAEHTDVFVLNCPPYASIHLGPEGGIGGDAADRVAGFWRVLGMEAPAEPDHLSSLLGLYAHLVEAEAEAAGGAEPATRDGRARVEAVSRARGEAVCRARAEAIGRARRSLLWEHLWPWVPNWLDAVTDLQAKTLGGWAQLTRAALEREARSQPGGHLLPAALRSAPPPLQPGCGTEELLDALVSPLRSGLVLSRASLARIAQDTGAGYRLGERRFTLRAMLAQDRDVVMAAMVAEAARWSERQAQRAIGDAATVWWARRSADTAAALVSRSDGPMAMRPSS